MGYLLLLVLIQYTNYVMPSINKTFSFDTTSIDRRNTKKTVRHSEIYVHKIKTLAAITANYHFFIIFVVIFITKLICLIFHQIYNCRLGKF